MCVCEAQQVFRPLKDICLHRQQSIVWQFRSFWDPPKIHMKGKNIFYIVYWVSNYGKRVWQFISELIRPQALFWWNCWETTIFFVINNLTIFCSSGLFNQNWCSSLLFFLYSIFRYKKQSLHLSLSLSPSLLQTNVLQRCHLTKNKNLIFHPARCYFFSCCIRSFQRRGKLLQGE